MKDTIVLYHRGCNDGIVAAWAVRQKLGMGPHVKYFPYQYGEKLPVEVFGNHVIMVDLSVPEKQLAELRQEVESVLIIDHHKTAEPLQAAMRPVRTYSEDIRYRSQGDMTVLYFDKEHSGAVLTLAFFNDHKDIDTALMPMALKLIEDYDLWKHEHPASKAVNAWLINGGLSMDRVDQLMSHDGEVPEEVLLVGRALMRYDDKIIKSVLREYVVEETLDDGTTLAIVNAPHHLRNEIGDRLADKYDFVALYTYRKEKVIWSLRSKSYDVSKVAEKFDGGGHHLAAAFARVHHPIRHPFHRFSIRRRLKAAWYGLIGK